MTSFNLIFLHVSVFPIVGSDVVMSTTKEKNDKVYKT